MDTLIYAISMEFQWLRGRHPQWRGVRKLKTAIFAGWTGQLPFFKSSAWVEEGVSRLLWLIMTTFLWDGLLKYSEGNDRQRAFCFVLWSLLFSFFSFRDFGVHIDGYIAVIGHTIVVGASKVSWKCYWKSWGNPILSLSYFLGCD